MPAEQPGNVNMLYCCHQQRQQQQQRRQQQRQHLRIPLRTLQLTATIEKKERGGKEGELLSDLKNQGGKHAEIGGKEEPYESLVRTQRGAGGFGRGGRRC